MQHAVARKQWWYKTGGHVEITLSSAGKHHLNMASLQDDSSSQASSSQGENRADQSTDAEVGLVEVDGAIGIYKNRAFQPLTNFGIKCHGFVSSGKNVEGYLIEVVPAHCQCVDQGGDQSQR